MTRLIAAVGIAALIGACGTSATPPTSTSGSPPAATSDTASALPTSSPVASAQATAELSPEPAETAQTARLQWAQDPPRPILTGGAVRVVVDELNVRERPTTLAAVLGTVSRGNVLIVSGPPIESGEHIWYSGVYAWDSAAQVPALPRPFVPPRGGEPLVGWFAASTGATVYVEQLVERCPEVVDLKNVAAMLPAEHVACFGDRSLQLKGTIGCIPCSPEIFGEYAPDWLTNPNRVDDLLWVEYMEAGNVLLRFPPRGPDRPDPGSIIRVRGHFRDEAAENCSLGLAFPWSDAFRFHPVGPAAARQLCRQQFVVESYDLIGTDPAVETR